MPEVVRGSSDHIQQDTESLNVLNVDEILKSFGFKQQEILEVQGDKIQLHNIMKNYADLTTIDIKEFIDSNTQVNHQKKAIYQLQEKGLSSGEIRLKIINDFSRGLVKLLKILNDKGLSYYVYSVVFDKPFTEKIEVTGPDRQDGIRRRLCDFNFDIFYNDDGKPSIVLGNFQGSRRNSESMHRHQRRIGQTLSNFLVDSFCASFEDEGDVMALNPKYHEAYNNGLSYVVMLSLLRKAGKVTEKEVHEYTDRRLGDNMDTESVHAEIGQRVERIINEANANLTKTLTGMHKSVYKKAGFKRDEAEMYWTRPTSTEDKKVAK